MLNSENIVELVDEAVAEGEAVQVPPDVVVGALEGEEDVDLRAAVGHQQLEVALLGLGVKDYCVNGRVVNSVEDEAHELVPGVYKVVVGRDELLLVAERLGSDDLLDVAVVLVGVFFLDYLEEDQLGHLVLALGEDAPWRPPHEHQLNLPHENLILQVAPDEPALPLYFQNYSLKINKAHEILKLV